MRKPLIAALELVSLVSLADMAFASDPHPTARGYSRAELQSSCKSTGGRWSPEKLSGSYMCTFPGGTAIECNKNSKCETWTPLTRGNNKTGAVGGLNNGQLPGSASSSGGASGTVGTAPARAPTTVSADGTVVRDHRGIAPVAPARSPTTVGASNAGANGTVVRDHRSIAK